MIFYSIIISEYGIFIDGYEYIRDLIHEYMKDIR